MTSRPPLHDVHWANTDQGPRCLMSWSDVFGALATFGLLILVGYLIAAVVIG